MMNDITVEWLLTLTDFSTGNYLYNPEFNTSVSMVPVDVNMTWNELLRAYPYVNLGQYGDWGNTAIKDVLHEELVW